jgi:lathosterol oxidase
MEWLDHYGQVAQNVGTRYYLVAGTAFLLFYLVLRRWTAPRKIQAAFPKWNDYAREILYSSFTILIFALVPSFLIFSDFGQQHNTLYREIGDRGMIYYFGLFPVLFFIHDTYFYWAHRLMHLPKLYRYVHLVHHRSTNPSPWAAYAFHPLEAVVEVGIFAVFLLLVPVHITHILLFFLMSIVYNVYGHLGWELYPKGFHRTWIGRWINTSVSHNQHHRYFHGNYGLYFLFWDRWMGTLREDYDEAYDALASRG